MCGRFVASMLMHINVEKDVRMGLNMMKYVVNHSENFHSVGPPFLMGLFHFIISLTVEFNVMLILTSTGDLLNVVMKFVSLTVFVKIPGFYASSLVNHRGVKMCDLQLPITNYRKDSPLKGKSCYLYVLRFIYKCLRIAFCSISYYFMPFMAIIINFQFMVGSSQE